MDCIKRSTVNRIDAQITSAADHRMSVSSAASQRPKAVLPPTNLEVEPLAETDILVGLGPPQAEQSHAPANSMPPRDVGVEVSTSVTSPSDAASLDQLDDSVTKTVQFEVQSGIAQALDMYMNKNASTENSLSLAAIATQHNLSYAELRAHFQE